MDKITAILSAATAILDAAAGEVKAFITKNTPESALLSALAFAYTQYGNGNLNGTQFALAVFTALVTFVVTESSKDKLTAGLNPQSA